MIAQHSRFGLWAALVLSAAFGVPAAAQETAPTVRAIRLPAATVVEAGKRQMTATVPVNGSLVARETVSVMPQVTGYQITEVNADVGDSVEKGAVLVRLDRAPLETQLKQADAEIAGAEASIGQAKSQIDGQQSGLTKAEATLGRAQRLLRNGAGAQATLDDAEANFTSATSALKGARSALTVAEAQLEQAKARRDDTALQLARTDVVAPVAGIVATRNANVGQNAGTGETAMFTLIRDGEIEFDGRIIETALADVRRGQGARIRLSGFPERSGTVRLLSPNVDPTTRQGSVRISIDDDRGLPIGIFASALIVTAERETVAVPLSAVVPSSSGNTVQVVGTDGVIHVRPVVTGIVAGTLVEIAEGLAAGETVVAKAGPFFRDGMTIRAVPVSLVPDAPANPNEGREEADLGRSAPTSGAAVTR